MAAPSAAPQAGGDETGETSRYYPVCLPMQIIHQDRSSVRCRARALVALAATAAPEEVKEELRRDTGADRR